MQITQLNVITEIPLDFLQKYQTVPRPNRRATVSFGMQLISVGCILLKKSQRGPCQPSRFLPASPAFYAKCPSKNILQVGSSGIYITTFWRCTLKFTKIPSRYEQNPADHDVLDIIKHSPYTDEEKLMADLTIKQNDFAILCLNCQSLSAKIDGLKIILKTLKIAAK